MAAGYRWHPIEDLTDAGSLTDGELVSLLRVWRTRRKELEASGEYEEFDKRLRREWAIETGVIEDVFTLDRGVTRTLIQRGIEADYISRGATNKDPVFVAQVIRDHMDALEGLVDFVRGQRELTAGYIKELHAALLRSVDSYMAVDQFGTLVERRLEKGKYKETPNSPTRADGKVHEYCPPEHVAAEMDALVRMHGEHVAQGVPAEVEAAWLHHRFTQIHPFADGNGRVARALASLVFLKAGWFPVVIRRDAKVGYIDDLERADAGDLRGLVGRFVDWQRTSLIEASEVIYELKPVGTAHEAVLAARDRLVQRRIVPEPELGRAVANAQELFKKAQSALEAVGNDLTAEIGRLRPGFGFRWGRFPPKTDYTKILRSFGLKPSPEFSEGLTLTLMTERTDFLIIAFQALGPRFSGLVAAVVFLLGEGAGATHIGTFQANYEEEMAAADSRFAVWLDGTIVRALNEWRKRL